MAWLTGWNYRKRHIINEATNAGTGYQIRIRVYYGSGTDSGENVYLGGKCKTDFGDIRFTDASGNLLNYWIESKTNSDNALFWVEIAGDLSSNDQLIYIYYGNSSAASQSSGSNTFVDFDDFTSNTLSSYTQIDSGWTIDTSGSGYLKIGSTSQGFISKSKSLTRNYAIMSKFYMSNSDAGIGFIWGSAGGSEASVSGYIANYYPSTTYSEFRRYSSGTCTRIASLPALSSGWYRAEVRATSNTISVVRESAADTSVTDTTFTSFNGIGFRQKGANTYAVDWWALRKYVDPEPSHGSWGNEETSEGVTWLSGWNYRKKHVINGSTSGARGDYQVRIKVYYDSGTDSEENVYLNNKCQSDFDDLRFVYKEGHELLSYWIEEKVDSNYAIVWVKVPYIPASPNTTEIYIYYGNSDATTTSNGASTFIFFDNFTNDRSSNGSWSNLFTESFGGKYVLSQIAGYSDAVVTLSSTVSNFGMEFRYYIVSKGTYGPRAGIRFIENGSSRFYDLTNEIGSCNNNYYHIRYFNDSEFSSLVRDGNSYSIGTWYRNYLYRYSTSGTLVAQLGASTTMSTTHSTLTSFNRIGFSTWDSGNKYYIDWIAVRKYVSPEPSHGSWGTEEQSGNTYSTTLSESVSFNEVLSRNPIKRVSEVMSCSDSFLRTWSLNRIITKVITTSDLISRSIGKSRSEVMALTDSIIRSLTVSRIFSETMQLIDTLRKSINKLLTDKTLLDEQTVANGLVAYWKFDESSGNIVYDSIGNNNGTIVGGTWENGIIDKALSLDGIDDYCKIEPFTVYGWQEITISEWIYAVYPKANSSCSKSSMIGDFWVDFPCMFHGTDNRTDYTSLFTHWSTRREDNTRGAYGYNWYAWKNQWVHIVIRFTSSREYSVWINGEKKYNVTVPSNEKTILEWNPDTATYPSKYKRFVFGASSALGECLTCKMDEVRIYNRALSDSEIKQLYKLKPKTDISRTITKLLSLIDSAVKQTARKLSDIINVTSDSISKSVVRTLQESLGIPDYFLTNYIRVLSEVVYLLYDIKLPNKLILQETINLLQHNIIFGLSIDKVFSENVNISDMIGFGYFEALFELLSLSDTLKKHPNKLLYELVMEIEKRLIF